MRFGITSPVMMHLAQESKPSYNSSWLDAQDSTVGSTTTKVLSVIKVLLNSTEAAHWDNCQVIKHAHWGTNFRTQSHYIFIQMKGFSLGNADTREMHDFAWCIRDREPSIEQTTLLYQIWWNDTVTVADTLRHRPHSDPSLDHGYFYSTVQPHNCGTYRSSNFSKTRRVQSFSAASRFSSASTSSAMNFSISFVQNRLNPFLVDFSSKSCGILVQASSGISNWNRFLSRPKYSICTKRQTSAKFRSP